MGTNERRYETLADGDEYPQEFTLARPDTVQRLIDTPDEFYNACVFWEWEADDYRRGDETTLAIGLRDGYHRITKLQDGILRTVDFEDGQAAAVALEYFRGLTYSLMFAGDLVGIQIPSLGHFLASIVTDLFKGLDEETLEETSLLQTAELRPSVAPAWEAAHFDIRRLQFFAERKIVCIDDPDDSSLWSREITPDEFSQAFTPKLPASTRKRRFHIRKYKVHPHSPSSRRIHVLLRTLPPDVAEKLR